MSGWLWLLIAAALIVLLLCTRLKVTGRFDESGGSLVIGFGFLTLLTLPGKNRKKRAKTARIKKTKKEKKTGSEERAENGGPVPAFRELTGIIATLLGKLRRRLCVDELTLWYLSAAEDPTKAALAFGGANAAAGLLLRPLEAVFRIRKKDIRTAVSFTETRPTVYAVLRLSLSLFTILELGGTALFLYRKARKRAAKTEV